jgi:hypothetical protein
MLALGHGDGVAASIEDDEAAGRGALVDGADVTVGVAFPWPRHGRSP